MAEGVGFEPTLPFGKPVFKTGALSRSATPPAGILYRFGRTGRHVMKTFLGCHWPADGRRSPARGTRRRCRIRGTLHPARRTVCGARQAGGVRCETRWATLLSTTTAVIDRTAMSGVWSTSSQVPSVKQVSASSSDRASSTWNALFRVLISSRRCPPQPSASPRSWASERM